MTVILELRDGTKEYRGVPALRDVTFTLERGEVHALLGENGAGKSTLTKMLAGVVSPTSGRILLDGAPVELTSPADALRKGIAMVYQETSLVPSLTVAQNLYLARCAVVQPPARDLHRRAAVPAIPEFPRRSGGAGLEPGRGPEADGGDRPRGSPQGAE